MLNCFVPEGVRWLADRTKDLASGRLACFRNLCAFYTMYLLGLTSMSDVARTCPWSFSVSDLSRALDGFDGNRFMRRMRASILKKYDQGERLNNQEFCFAIDDTDNPKYGSGIFRSSNWSGSKGKYHGQKIVVIVLVDIVRGFALPLTYSFAIKKTEPDYKSSYELGLEMFSIILRQGFPPLPVTSDSWFDSVAFMKGLKELGLDYCGELKSNRNVKTNPSPNVKRIKLKDAFHDRKRGRLRTRLDSDKIKYRKRKPKTGATARIMINNYPSMLTAVAVYNARNSKQAFAYYASTDLTMTGARLWELSRARWKIECLFRDLKQNLSFGRLPAAGKEAADLAVCMPFMIYTSLRLDPPENWGLERHEPIAMMVQRIREKELTRSIELIVANGNHSNVQRLKARRANINRKPRISTAGSYRKAG